MKPFDDDMAAQHFTVEVINELGGKMAVHLAVGIPRRPDPTDVYVVSHSGKSSRYLLNRIAVRVEEVAQEELEAFVAAQGK